MPCNSLNESIAQWKWKRNCKPVSLIIFQIVKVCDVVTPEVTTEGNYYGMRYKTMSSAKAGQEKEEGKKNNNKTKIKKTTQTQK